MDAAIPGILAMMAGSGSGGGGGGLSYSLEGSGRAASPVASQNFTVDIGAANAGDYIAVFAHSQQEGGHSSVTVDGVSATKLADQINSVYERGSWWIAQVDTGGSVTVNLSSPSGGRDKGVVCYRLTEYSPTPHDTAGSTGGALSINIPTDGLLLAGSYCRTNSGAASYTWSGAAKDTEEYVATDGGFARTTASEDGLASETGRSVDATYGAAVSREVHVAVSFAPV
jgi:hypothetical protein